jgi:hypothetical protein
LNSGTEAATKPIVIPKIPGLDRRVFEAASAPGALEMTSWHICQKTHCRAGWIVALAGPEGRALEQFYNTELAAMLIYRESTGRRINPARFYDDNDEALADMKRLAEGEANG